MADIKKISGYRINFLEDPKVRQFRFARMMQDLEPLVHLVDMWKQEPLYLDDIQMIMPPAEVLNWGMGQSELFVVIHERAIIGTIKLMYIIPERSAEMTVWAVPQIREGYRNHKIVHGVAKEIIDYAFLSVPQGGLGLMKLKATICAKNLPALKAARALKFKQFGISPLDAFHGGQVYDTVKLELHNPAYFASVIEDLVNVPATHAAVAVVPASSTPADTTESIPVDQRVDTPDTDAESSTGDSELVDRATGRPSPSVGNVGTVRGKPFKPRRPGAI